MYRTYEKTIYIRSLLTRKGNKMKVRELIDLMSETESICIEDIDKQIDVMELYCGAAGDLKQDNPIMDMEIIGIVAVNDLLYAGVRNATKQHWGKYGNKRTCSKCNFSYFTGDDSFKYCPDCGAKMKEISKVKNEHRKEKI